MYILKKCNITLLLVPIIDQLNLTIENREKELSRTYLVEELNKMKDKKSSQETLIPKT